MADQIRANVRFYAELNDFLPKARRGIEIACSMDRTSVKDLIERLGVPHGEVDLVLVNGHSESFGYLVRDGDRISVYPVFESLDIGNVTRVRPEPLRQLRFVADAHLGKLAMYLRLLGLDTLYKNDWPDNDLVDESVNGGRVLLTRDRGLLKRAAIQRGYCLRNDGPVQQLAEVVHRFDLKRLARPFTRCVRCNGLLAEVRKEDVLDRLEPKTRQYYDTFQECQGCGQIYWRGSHYKRMKPFLQAVLTGELPDARPQKTN